MTIEKDTLSRREGDRSKLFDPLCNDCRRYRGYARCSAYPHRIPIAYLTGDEDCSQYFKRHDDLISR